ncbi:hypothetical protein OAV62_01905 [bacterium]|nr:hypothetical protein [bacterium]
MNTLQSLIIHGSLIPEHFKLPNNIRVISYDCPKSLSYSSAPVFQCFRTHAQTLDDIVNEFSFYTDEFFDFAVHEPGTNINNLSFSYTIMDPDWKLGYFVPKPQDPAPRYKPSTMRSIGRTKAYSTAEAQKCINPRRVAANAGWLHDDPYKSYSSGNLLNMTYMLNLPDGEGTLKDIVKIISQLSKRFCNSHKIINLLVWTCKTSPLVHDESFIRGMPLAAYLPSADSIMPTYLDTDGTTEEWYQIKNDIQFFYDIDSSNFFSPKILIYLRDSGRKIDTSSIRNMLLYALESFLYVLSNTTEYSTAGIGRTGLSYKVELFIELDDNKKFLLFVKSLGFKWSRKNTGWVVYKYTLRPCKPRHLHV